jgi:uncharacterized protein (TIGR00730 family)
MTRARKTSTNVISLADEDAVRDAVWASIQGLWKTVNTLTRLRPSRRPAYRVSIFGSARIEGGSVAYEETKRMAKALGAMGCDIITGGGPGLMQAANEGAKAGRRGKSYGIRVDLPFEQHSNAFVTESFDHETFFTRLQQFVMNSDAFVVTPGGIGTVLETLMIWQLLQVNHLQNAPLVLVGGMWPGLVDWARKAMLSTDPPLASRKDLGIPSCVPDADAAIALIRAHHRRWKTKRGASR